MAVNGHTFNESAITSDSIVLDIGGNHGDFSREVLERFKCYVECFEPDQDGCSHIRQMINDPKFTLINKAVAGISGRRSFYRVGPINGGNSLLPGSREYGKDPGNTIFDVDVVSLDSILDKYQTVDLIKMDCEGAEIEIIEKTQQWSKVKQITIEFHDFCFKSITLKDVERCEDILKSYGFNSQYQKHEDHLFYR
jgi:FkbM family methyltransferase